MQLDIFEHSRDVMLRNDVLDALQRRDTSAARRAWERFASEMPQDDTLPLLQRLLHAIESPDTAAFADARSAGAALRQVREELSPAAQQLLGSTAAAAWLQPFWRRLAQRCTRLAFDAKQSELHAAALWLVAGEWAAAASAAASVESWRRIPAPLAWMAEASYRRDGLLTPWGLLAELAWLSPGRFEALSKRLDDPVLRRLLRSFNAGFEGQGDVGDLAWLPAWCLIEKPDLAGALAAAQPALQTPPERALRTLLEMQGLERQGRHRDLVAQRKLLRDLQPSLYAAYMRLR